MSQCHRGWFLNDTSCVRLPGVEGVLGVSVEEARLSHPGVAERQELDQVVVIHLSQSSVLSHFSNGYNIVLSCSKYDNIVVIQLLISLSLYIS